MTRRNFFRVLGGGVAAGAGTAGAAAYARYVEPYWPAIETLPMDIPRLPAPLAGLRIAQVSDLHVSASVPADWLREQLTRLAEHDSDLVLLTGDYVTGRRRRWIDALPDVLAPLRPRLGAFAVLGNHDYGVYSSRSERRAAQGRAVTQALERAGVRVLRNDVARVTVAGATLQVIGLDDLWSGQCDPASAAGAARGEQPTILLAHNPDTLYELPDFNWDWLLCGHTHGGQVRIPGYGAPLLPVRGPYEIGRYELGPRRLYVNRGLGCIRQVRFNCRPEMTLFELTTRA
jgi:predicted MPP superfamily phosphohydrolase